MNDDARAMVLDLHGCMSLEVEAIRVQASQVTAAQSRQAQATSSQEVEDTKQQALVELKAMQDQLGTVMATYASEVERLSDQSDRDTSALVSPTAAATAAEQRAKNAGAQAKTV